MEHATITKYESVPVGNIHNHPDNARRGNTAAIARSLRENGLYKPIVVHEETGDILVGNHTFRAAVDKLGWTHIDVAYVKCTAAKARAILAVDNKSSDLGGYDDEALAALLEQINSDELLDAAGYDLADLDDLLAQIEEHEPHTPDLEEQAPDDIKEAKSLSDKADNYDAQLSRMVVLNYPIEQFSFVVEQLETLAEKFGMDNNADVVLSLIEDATDRKAPPAKP